MKSDSELDSLGREKPHEHEWSEWVTIDKQILGIPVPVLKIRVCKICKKLEGDLV